MHLTILNEGLEFHGLDSQAFWSLTPFLPSAVICRPTVAIQHWIGHTSSSQMQALMVRYCSVLASYVEARAARVEKRGFQFQQNLCTCTG